MLLVGLMCLITIEGTPILNFKSVAANNINWDVYVMVAAAMAISGALTNPATGVLDMMILVFEPILGGHSPTTFFIVMLLFGIVVTSFASSLVLGVAIAPLLVIFGSEAGVVLPALAATNNLLMHYQIILPSASVFAAMLWSNHEWITPKEVFRYGGFIVTIAIIAAIIVIMPLSILLLG
jgi:sodium-dependent dicarboxylate transporter 2/3/5